VISGTLKLLTLGIVAFFVSLIATVPAEIAGRYLPTDVRATGLRGTLWHGRASQLQVRGFDLGEVVWNAHPLALLVGRLQSSISINRPDLQGQGTAGVGFHTLRLSDADLIGRAELLAPLLSNYGVSIDGRFEANIKILQFNGRGPQAADGVIVWQSARLLQPTKLEFGDVTTTLNQDGNTATADVKNTGDSLRLTGTGQLHQGWAYDARLHIEPTATTPKQFRNTLPLLAKPNSRGTITLNQQGTLAAVAASMQ
jgi:hypothetical protein